MVCIRDAPKCSFVEGLVPVGRSDHWEITRFDGSDLIN